MCYVKLENNGNGCLADFINNWVDERYVKNLQKIYWALL